MAARRKMHTVRGEILARRLYLYCGPSDQRGFSRKLKLPVAVGKCLFHPSAFCNIDIDTDHPLWVLLAIVRDETARLDPSYPAVWENNAIL